MRAPVALLSAVVALLPACPPSRATTATAPRATGGKSVEGTPRPDTSPAKGVAPGEQLPPPDTPRSAGAGTTEPRSRPEAPRATAVTSGERIPHHEAPRATAVTSGERIPHLEASRAMRGGGAEPPALPDSPRTAVGHPVPPAVEVALTGTWRSQVPGVRGLAVAQVEPCLPVPAAPTRLGEVVTLPREGPLSARFVLPQGAVASVCVYAVNAAGVTVGAAAVTPGPTRFFGLEARRLGPVDVIVTPLGR